MFACTLPDPIMGLKLENRAVNTRRADCGERADRFVPHGSEVLGDEPVMNLDVFTPKRAEYAN